MPHAPERLAAPLDVRVGHWNGDPSTGVAIWSEGMCALVGVPAFAPDGTPVPYGRDAFFAHVHPEDRDRAITEMTTPYLDGASSAATCCRLRQPDGSVRHVSVLVHFLRDDAGAMIRSLGVVFDETEVHRNRQQAERIARRLERAERVRRAVSQTLDLGAVMTEVAATLHDLAQPDRLTLSALVEEDPSRQIVRVVLGQGAEASLPPSEAPVIGLLQPLIGGSADVVHLTPGNAGPVGLFLASQGLREAYSFALRTDGRTIGLLHVAFARSVDLTSEQQEELTALAGHIAPALAHALLLDRMQAHEAQLRHRQKLEAVGQLAAGVAHDLNNLLTVVQSSCSLLAHSLGPGPHTEDVQAIATAGERAAQLTARLLAFGRQQLVRPEAVVVDARIRSLLDLLQRALVHPIEVHTDLAADDATVLIDPASLDQVLLNLALNARDALPPTGGRLDIATEVLPAAADRPPTVRIRVADDGVGMPPEILERIFEPFFTTKGHDRGTGLGLSTSYGIVTQAGGTMEVRSRPGVGTTFDIELPCCPPEGTGAVAPHPRLQVPVDRPLTVLLVDDERLVRAAIQRLLQGMGHLVLTAADGAEAVALATDHSGPIDVLLTDLWMPTMPGMEVVPAVQAVRPDVAVLLMTGHVDGDQRDDVRASGHPLLTKPFDRATLAKALLERFTRPA